MKLSLLMPLHIIIKEFGQIKFKGRSVETGDR